MKKLNKKAAILACFSLSLAMGTVGVASLSNETVSANSTLVMEKGASLYLDDVSGLKFSFTDSAYDENATYGMLIVPFDYLAKAGITDLETETDFIGKLNQAKEDGLIEKAPLVKEVLPDENKVFSHSVGNLYEYNYVREFFGIGYKEVSEGVYEYAQPADGYKREDNVRSVFEVANLALNKLEYEEWGENAEDLAEKAKLDEYSGGEDGVANTKDDTLDNFIVKGLTFVYGTATPTLTAEATYVGGEVTPTVATAKQKDIDLAMHWYIDESVLARGRHNVEATLGGVITQACPV
ncbi:MAG: hypothetical protein IJD33_00810, partial [Clostridia bacterium]|nr:hypothetical protein [Clostridia bacterium]